MIPAISLEVTTYMAQVVSGRGAEPSEEGQQDEGKHPLGRRALLTRGGIVAAGVVGAGAVATAVAGPASAAAGDAVLQDTVNDAGTSATPTELDADNDTTPAFILGNTGVDSTNDGAGPNLRLTPSTASGSEPTASTVGGDLTSTGTGAFAGTLWFTHDFGGTPADIVAAPVHTEATANVYAPLPAPVRILDTRSASGRTNIVNASGNLNSAGQLEAGKTIYINLDSQVFFAETVLANVTVTTTEAAGFLTIWSGSGTRPTTSSINYVKSQTLCNFVACVVAEHSSTVANAIAIYSNETTHVILDVAGYIMPGFEYANYTVGSANAAAKSARLQRAQQAIRNANRA
jgi:hypothetical protein